MQLEQELAELGAPLGQPSVRLGDAALQGVALFEQLGGGSLERLRFLTEPLHVRLQPAHGGTKLIHRGGSDGPSWSAVIDALPIKLDSVTKIILEKHIMCWFS